MLKKIHWTDTPCREAEGKVNNFGYAVHYCKKRKRTVLSHIVACIEAHGPRPSKEHRVDHLCENKKCINPHHLEWVTHAENNRRRCEKPRAPRRQFSDEQVLWAVNEVNVKGRTITSVAEELDAPLNTVAKWVTGLNRSKLTGIKYNPRPKVVHE